MSSEFHESGKFRIAERILHFALNLLFKRRDIAIDGDLYLRRWFLWGHGTDSQWFLHNIRRADKGRELHDHPWNFSTRILFGGYREQVLVKNYTGDGVFEVMHSWRTGDFYKVNAEHTHRIDAVFGSTYTLVNTGPARRSWGFWKSRSKDAWVDHRDYLKVPADVDEPVEDQVK